MRHEKISHPAQGNDQRVHVILQEGDGPKRKGDQYQAEGNRNERQSDQPAENPPLPELEQPFELLP